MLLAHEALSYFARVLCLALQIAEGLRASLVLSTYFTTDTTQFTAETGVPSVAQVFRLTLQLHAR
jgi:hypothetical protein